ncbi:MAG: hypothetical protein OXE50_10045, partial [Chloroflexi bacterium]|nr:hypothetical protein [Chloroflexota bacterium]
GNARGEVASYLTDVEEVIREHRQRVRIRSEDAARNVLLNDESFYAEWTPKAQKLAVAGQTILDDPASYAAYLKHHPQSARRIHESVDNLASTLGPDAPALVMQRRQETALQNALAGEETSFRP